MIIRQRLQLDKIGPQLKTVQEKIVSKPRYDASNRKSYKYTDEIDKELDSILESEKEKLRY